MSDEYECIYFWEDITVRVDGKPINTVDLLYPEIPDLTNLNNEFEK